MVIVKKFILMLLAAALLASPISLINFGLSASAAPSNLIPNSSVETANPSNPSLPASWEQGSWGTNSPVFSYLNNGYNSNHSVEVQMNSYSSGDAKWYFDPISVTGNTQYSFSDYYQSNVNTDVVAQFADASGNYTYVDLGAAANSSAWQQYNATFTTPANTVSLTIFHIINSVGFLITDDFSLGASVASSNLIANPSAETANPSNPSLPASWNQGNWGTNTPVFSYLNSGYNSNRSLEVQMNSYSSGDAKWYFDPISVTGNTKYSFSDYYQSNVGTDVVAQFEDASGNYTYADLGSVASSPSWQQDNATFTTPANTVSLTIFHLINSVGFLITDGYSLTVNTSPNVTITAPVSSTITGSTTLSATATASSGVASVQFMLDGQNLGAPTTTAPYQMSWNSATTSNGTHSLTAVATGMDGTQGTSQSVTIIVENANPVSGNLIPNSQLTNVDPKNPSLPQDWQRSSWGTNSPSFSYLSNGYNDSRSVSVTMSNYSSGDAKWFFSPQLVTPDTQYRYSEYYKSTVQTQVMAVFKMNDGSTLYQYIGLPDTANNWTNFTTTFSIPHGTANVTIYHLINANGSLTTDDFSMGPYTPTGFKRPLLSLTFDDGYSSTFRYGLPLLQKDGFSSTQFIITDLIGQTGYMTKSNVKTLYLDKQEVASHTLSHSDLTQETIPTMTSELSQSQALLKSWINAPITDMAYPYGLYNTNVINAVKNYYTGARGVEDGLNSQDNFTPYDIKVQNVFINTTTAQVADWVKQAQATNTWLVLVYHSVDPNTSSPIDGDQYNVTPTQLSNQLTAIKSSGITVENMQAALAEVEAQL